MLQLFGVGGKRCVHCKILLLFMNSNVNNILKTCFPSYLRTKGTNKGNSFLCGRHYASRTFSIKSLLQMTCTFIHSAPTLPLTSMTTRRNVNTLYIAYNIVNHREHGDTDMMVCSKNIYIELIIATQVLKISI